MKKRVEQDQLDSMLKEFKLKQDIYGKIQEEGLRKIAYENK